MHQELARFSNKRWKSHTQNHARVIQVRCKTAFSFGNDGAELARYAWCEAKSSSKTHAVGCKQPNAFGLYDMLGNVWEWCSDWYSGTYYASSPSTDPQGPESGIVRVLRGGSWDSELGFLRCASRLGCAPDDTSDVVGFRVVLEQSRVNSDS